MTLSSFGRPLVLLIADSSLSRGDTMSDAKARVCPVERAGSLDNRTRRWLQNPRKILGPYIKEGMTVLDLGCGPGFFLIEIAQMVGESGRVIACDLQEGMLQKVRDKVRGTDLEARITLHKCETDRIGWSDEVDFALAFYMVHEIPDQRRLFAELSAILRPEGQILVVEPPFHVSKSAFRETIRVARAAGFTPEEGPKVIFSKTVILKRGDRGSGGSYHQRRERT
jgi:ubiquinone/menaquinone biosynthesis C-methylase UbiE